MQPACQAGRSLPPRPTERTAPGLKRGERPRGRTSFCDGAEKLTWEAWPRKPRTTGTSDWWVPAYRKLAQNGHSTQGDAHKLELPKPARPLRSSSVTSHLRAEPQWCHGTAGDLPVPITAQIRLCFLGTSSLTTLAPGQPRFLGVHKSDHTNS